jgi:hypothetical protein
VSYLIRAVKSRALYWQGENGLLSKQIEAQEKELAEPDKQRQNYIDAVGTGTFNHDDVRQALPTVFMATFRMGTP